MQRVAHLPRRGTLLVSTDLHGNGEDLRALALRFAEEFQRDPSTHWLVLGDAVHGPDDGARASEPELYGYPDESWAVVEALDRLVAEHPGQVLYLLGNHDFAHLGGPRTSRFHPDEAARFEATLTRPERERLWRFFASAHLAAVTPCGLLFAHGSPDDSLESLAELDAIDLGAPRTGRKDALLGTWLNSYGQPEEVCARLLAKLAPEAPGLAVVVHGHDRDRAGWFAEGRNQLCPVLFGAPRAQKRYLRVDLAAQYRSVADLREGQEILRLYG